MLGFVLKKAARVGGALCLVLALVSSVAWAQKDVTRSLTPAEAVTGTLSADNLAQVYTYDGAAGQIIQVSATTGPGVALLLTDANGQPLARAKASVETGQGTVDLPAVPLSQNGLYYVTVFVFSDAFVAEEGAFELTVTVEEGAVPEVTATVEPTVAPTAPSEYVPPGQIVTTTGMQVSLSWNSTADMNLQVRDPLGGSLFWDSRTAENGGTFGFDANGLCEVLTDTPTETASWPGGALATGSYEILIYYRSTCQNEGPVAFTVNVVIDGVTLAPIQGTLLPPTGNQQQVFISSFVLNSDGTVTPGPSGIYIDSAGLATTNLPSPTPIEQGALVTGSITNQQPYKTYAFSAQTNDLISISLTRTAGSLDTLLYLLGPNGNVVYSNDDIEFGNTDSALTNVRLAVDGQYTIVVTRYGQNLGGTEGTYELLFSGPTGNLPADVVALNLPQGDIEITLYWNTLADLQLLVRDPAGNSVFDDTPSIPSGGRLVAAGNINCTQTQTQPVSYIYWPTGFLRAGTYEVDVWYQNECGDTRPVDFTLIVSVDGKVVFTDTARPLPDDQYVSSFNIDVNREVTVYGGGIMNINTIDYRSKLDTAMTLVAGQPVRGNISYENPFDVYVYDGQAGDVVNISLNAIGGNLDTLLYVLDPNGNLLQMNDDAVVGEVTNSLVSDLTLAQDGQYIIIATRFGILYGATTGSYELTLAPRT